MKMHTRITQLTLSREVGNHSGYFTICRALQEVGIRVTDKEVVVDVKRFHDENRTFDLEITENTVHYTRLTGDEAIVITVNLREL